LNHLINFHEKWTTLQGTHFCTFNSLPSILTWHLGELLRWDWHTPQNARTWNFCVVNILKNVHLQGNFQSAFLILWGKTIISIIMPCIYLSVISFEHPSFAPFNFLPIISIMNWGKKSHLTSFNAGSWNFPQQQIFGKIFNIC
jgi:hypothetical protein